MEAFSDGVLAVIITVMVLELKVPKSADWSALRELLPVFLSYALSYVFLGIYWNNHHHLLQAITHVDGRVLWANLHLLFWLSLVPFATGWMGESVLAPIPTAAYGVVSLMAAVAFYVLVRALIRCPGQSPTLAAAIGSDRKGQLSPLLFAAAIPIALVAPVIAFALFVAVVCIWIVPDLRIERVLTG